MTMLSPAHPEQPASGDPAVALHAVANFVRGFSLEATRPSRTDIEELSKAAPPGTEIYLSALPKRSFVEAVDHATAIRAAGYEPVPHLAARSVESRAMLEEFLAQVTEQASVRRALVIAGDQDKAPGPFSDARDLIESGLLQKYDVRDIGISGYPEGHPRIRLETLDRALAAKVESAEHSGLRVQIVTQFGFDPQAIVGWVTRLRDHGFEQPVRIGMAGPTDLTTLLRFAARCGVRASAGSAARQAGLLKRLFAVSTPDAIVRAVSEAGGLGTVHAHFFSFGGIGPCARWASAVAAGRVAFDGDGFTVTQP